MKRMLGVLSVGLMVLVAGGCMAVSAKEVNAAPRYNAVADANGNIYIVDLKTATARPVRIVAESTPADDSDQASED